MSDKRTQKILNQLADAQGGWFCHYCGKALLTPDEAYQKVCDSDGRHLYTTVNQRYQDHPTIDHVIPKSHGGKNNMDNYVLACKSCNSKKCDRRVMP